MTTASCVSPLCGKPATVWISMSVAANAGPTPLLPYCSDHNPLQAIPEPFDVTRLLGAGFNFATREDYDMAKEWAERSFEAGKAAYKRE